MINLVKILLAAIPFSAISFAVFFWDEYFYGGKLINFESQFLTTMFSFLIIVLPFLVLPLSIYLLVKRKVSTIWEKMVLLLPLPHLLLLVIYLYLGLQQDYPQ